MLFNRNTGTSLLDLVKCNRVQTPLGHYTGTNTLRNRLPPAFHYQEVLDKFYNYIAHIECYLLFGDQKLGRKTH